MLWRKCDITFNVSWVTERVKWYPSQESFKEVLSSYLPGILWFLYGLHSWSSKIISRLGICWGDRKALGMFTSNLGFSFLSRGSAFNPEFLLIHVLGNIRRWLKLPSPQHPHEDQNWCPGSCLWHGPDLVIMAHTWGVDQRWEISIHLSVSLSLYLLNKF